MSPETTQVLPQYPLYFPGYIEKPGDMLNSPWVEADGPFMAHNLVVRKGHA